MNKASFATRFGAATAFAVSMVVLAGCCSAYRLPYGYVLRGDWSIELNRKPWLGSNKAERAIQAEMLEQPAVSADTQLPEAPSIEEVAPAQTDQAQNCSNCAKKTVRWPFCAAGCARTTLARSPDWVLRYESIRRRFAPLPTRPVFSPVYTRSVPRVEQNSLGNEASEGQTAGAGLDEHAFRPAQPKPWVFAGSKPASEVLVASVGRVLGTNSLN